ncbi:MAG: 2-oxo acid dehydrogenase subunit E2, partial [Chloroflexi bacterium]|nr:2-oxo acid dehydrogenase subunit E2 [Chloroflexota bacterium]
PRMNSSWNDGTIIVHPSVNIGLAVATDDGLMVPVVHGVERMSMEQITARRMEMVDLARSGKLRPEDVAGGTFSITNLGMYGVDAFDAIVNPPQAAILAVGRILDRVVALKGEPSVEPMMMLTLSVDHRAADGALAAPFLGTLASLLEQAPHP